MHKPPQAAVSVVVPDLRHGEASARAGAHPTGMHARCHAWMLWRWQDKAYGSRCPLNSWLRLGAVPAVSAAYSPVEPARREPATPVAKLSGRIA